MLAARVGAADEALQLLVRVPVFDTIPRAELAPLVATASEVAIVPGEIIVREGDPGDCMYIIAAGSVRVFADAFDGSDVVLARLDKGQFFGEQALLPGGTGRRNASVRALNNCKLVVLRAEPLLKLLEAHPAVLERLREAGQEQTTVLAGKRRWRRWQVIRNLGIADGCRIESFSAGQVVFREGEPGDQVYLLLSGKARVVSNGGETTVAELLPGQIFGELAVLNDQPRKATVVAETEIEVASLDGPSFRKAMRDHPQLKLIVDSMSCMYRLPSRGLVTLQTTKLDSQPTVTAIHNLPDGRRVVSTRFIGVSMFSSRVLDASEATDSVTYSQPDQGILRQLHLSEGRIVELDAEGDWDNLCDVFSLMLDGAGIPQPKLDAFRDHGDFVADAAERQAHHEMVCTCMWVSCGMIKRAIESGCDTLEAVATKTRATTVCGTCMPVVLDLLGRTGWTAARCDSITQLTRDVCAFRFRTLAAPCETYLPGQHILLQVRIDDRWIQRPYTLTSVSGEQTYEIMVKREPMGMLSRWLFKHLRQDMLVRISKPRGEYHLPPDHAADVVCFVGSIGLTPALAMARTLAGAPRPFRLHIDYSVSDEEQIILRDELAQLCEKNPKISIHTRITRRDGRLNAAEVQKVADSYAGATFYLCGSDGYMRAVADMLLSAGVSATRIKTESFTVNRPVTWPTVIGDGYEQLKLEIDRAVRYNRPLSFIVVEGELPAAPDLMRLLRTVDRVVPFDGRLVLALTETDRTGAEITRARLASIFAGSKFRVACCPVDGTDVASLVAAAR